MTAQRDNLRTRTDTVRIDISYLGVASEVGGIDLTPIHQSIKATGQTVVASTAWLISFLATALPWIPIVALIGWLARRGVRRWTARRQRTA
jgi:hypothetical protein